MTIQHFRHSWLVVVGGIAVALMGSLVACTSSSTATSPTGVALATGDSTSVQAPQVDICHLTDEGAFNLININGNAAPAHRAHGDAAPGEAVPGSQTDVFDSSCVATAAPLLACPCWNDYSSAGLVAAMNLETPTSPTCSVAALGASALDNDAQPILSAQNLPDSSGKRCSLQLTGVPLRSQLFLSAEVAAVCVAEATVIVPQIAWCPAG